MWSNVLLGALQVHTLGTICIDPGHPSEVGPGTRGEHITELHAAWVIAGQLRTRLEQRGYRVVLTKARENQLVRNRTRAMVANRAKALLMVRLHCDASNGSGFTVYFPDRQGTTQGVKGPPQSVLDSTRKAADRFHRSLARDLKGLLKDNGLEGDEMTAVGRSQGALTGSIFSRVPVVLIEMVVLTNPKDEAIMASRQGRERIVSALANATVAATSPPLSDR